MAASPLGSSAPSAPPEPVEQQHLGLIASDLEVFTTSVEEAEQARADLHVQTVCLLILAFVAAGVALYLLRPVLVPFVLALFFAACLKPLIAFEQRKLRMPQPVAVAGAILVAFVLIGLIGLPLVAAIVKMQPEFRSYFDQSVMTFVQKLPLQRFGLSAPNVRIPDEATSWFFSAVGKVTDLASATLLVTIFTLFILLGRRGEKQKSLGMLFEIELRVQRYINQMVLLSAIAGILVGVVLAVLHVKFAAVFGFLAFLLNFIPTVGSIIATLLPLPIILLSPEMGPTAKILSIAVPAAIQIYLGNAVQPRVLGNALDLHPIVILISLIFWSMIWGLPGAFLATPMTAVLRIVLEKIPATRPLADLLAGRLSAVF
ncbi:MAG TPA: AI-2E family transporter [Tepidisphaeraceae bacterium]|nr:AI-2E family transporter [Tepidisphaeraceae bacterium]